MNAIRQKFGVAVICVAKITACTLQSKRANEFIGADSLLADHQSENANLSASPSSLPPEVLEGLAGFYSLPSPRCTSAQSTDNCQNDFVDCLRIRRDTDVYLVDLYSVQAQQNLCSFNLTMIPSGNSLTYADSDGRKLELSRGNRKLILTTNGFSPSPGFCGAHGALDGIEFPESSKQQVDRVCFQDE